MSRKTLIVDSDWQFFRKVRDFLEPQGHYVVYEANADQALQRAIKWKPDVAFLSAEDPSCCDGSVLERFARISPRPAIVLTSHMDDFGKAWRAWQRGGDEVLFKPLLHPSELHIAIFSAMENAICPSRRPTMRPLAISA